MFFICWNFKILSYSALARCCRPFQFGANFAQTVAWTSYCPCLGCRLRTCGESSSISRWPHSWPNWPRPFLLVLPKRNQTFLHAMWECDAPQFAERPSLPTCNLQLCLGWPDPTTGHAQNTEVLVHMAEVRRDLTSMRWRWLQPSRAASTSNCCGSSTRRRICWNLVFFKLCFLYLFLFVFCFKLFGNFLMFFELFFWYVFLFFIVFVFLDVFVLRFWISFWIVGLICWIFLFFDFFWELLSFFWKDSNF